jgi:hypothetical protein
MLRGSLADKLGQRALSCGSEGIRHGVSGRAYVGSSNQHRGKAQRQRLYRVSRILWVVASSPAVCAAYGHIGFGITAAGSSSRGLNSLLRGIIPWTDPHPVLPAEFRRIGSRSIERVAGSCGYRQRKVAGERRKEALVPAVTRDDLSKLPTISAWDRTGLAERLVTIVTTAPGGLEGEGFPLPINDSYVSCRALHVALSAVQLYIAWHSGVITGNAAMATLGQEFNRTPLEAS